MLKLGNKMRKMILLRSKSLLIMLELILKRLLLEEKLLKVRLQEMTVISSQSNLVS